LTFFTTAKFENIPSGFFALYIFALLADTAVQCQEHETAKALYKLLEPHASLNIVGGWGTVTDGCVAHYLALLAASVGNTELALSHFESALLANARLNSPPLLARTQLAYARLLTEQPHKDQRKRANDLASSARGTFSVLGLDSYRSQAEALIGCHPQPTERARGVRDAQNAMTRVGDYWLIRFQGHTAHIRDMLGFAYIASIISASGKPVHVLDLVSRNSARQLPVSPLAGPDLKAKRAYREHLVFLEHEIALATEHNDIGRIDALQRERDGVISELAHAYGLFDRCRPVGSSVERARVSVKNRISSALTALKPYNERAFHHLTRSIKTGAYCCYSPEIPTAWTVMPAPEG
jgi:hypothetical protein